MIVDVVHIAMLFVAVYISAYLLTTFVDYDTDGRGIRIPKIIAWIFFLFCKREKYNVSSVCMQAGNYPLTIFFIAGNVFRFERFLSDNVQAFILIGVLLFMIVAVGISNFVLVRKKHRIHNS